MLSAGVRFLHMLHEAIISTFISMSKISNTVKASLRFGPAAATQHKVLSLYSSTGSKGVICDLLALDTTLDIA